MSHLFRDLELPAVPKVLGDASRPERVIAYFRANARGEQLLRSLTRDGLASFQSDGLPLHVWLTSRACEIIDVTLPTTIAAATGADELWGGVIYISNAEPLPPVIYHPTIVGVDCLEAIGAAIPIGGDRH